MFKRIIYIKPSEQKRRLKRLSFQNDYSLTGVIDKQARRFKQDELTAERTDTIIQECAVAISYNGISHAVMMLTPVNLEQFAIGFSLSEGVIDSLSDIRDMQLLVLDKGLEIQLQISSQQMAQLKGTRRTMAGVSGCGLCGKEALDQVNLEPNLVSSEVTIEPSALYKAQQSFGDFQPLQQQTGGIHGAAWCSLDGEIQSLFEDIGRHNAVDKLIGHLAIKEIDTAQGFIMVSSRISYEIIQKAARANIGLIAGVSAVSSLAIELATKSKVKLIGFMREGRYTVYN